MVNQDRAPFSHAVERDLRLDLFRGMGLWMIFLDHIPHDIVAWLTLRNYGFSDAAEFFVFISGYLAGFIYGPIVRGGHFLAATKRLVMRAWQMYVAHIMLFLLFTAQIARTVRKFDNPMYEDEFNVHNFLQHPDVLIGQALSLRYKPVNLDVLPLYISLMLASPLILWCLVRRPNWTLLGSAVLYVLARWFDWNFASYPPGTTWYFNPFAWQLLFIFAAWCGVGGAARLQFLIRSRVVLALAVAWILFALLIVMTWHVPFLESLVPKWMIKAIYPIDKTDLDMLRLTHFLALAVVVTRYLPRNWAPLTSKWLRPLILCGQHSLPIFCGCVASGSGCEGPQSVRRGGRVRSRQGGDRTRESVIPCWRSREAPAEAGAASNASLWPAQAPPHKLPSQFVPFLAQRFGQTRA